MACAISYPCDRSILSTRGRRHRLQPPQSMVPAWVQVLLLPNNPQKENGYDTEIWSGHSTVKVRNYSSLLQPLRVMGKWHGQTHEPLEFLFGYHLSMLWCAYIEYISLLTFIDTLAESTIRNYCPERIYGRRYSRPYWVFNLLLCSGKVQVSSWALAASGVA